MPLETGDGRSAGGVLLEALLEEVLRGLDKEKIRKSAKGPFGSEQLLKLF